MRKDLTAETIGTSTKEDRKTKLSSCSQRDEAEREDLESRAGGRRRSSRTTRSGGAQTRRREANMVARKKSVLAHLHGRVQDLALGEPTTTAVFFFSIRARYAPRLIQLVRTTTWMTEERRRHIRRRLLKGEGDDVTQLVLNTKASPRRMRIQAE